MDKAVLGYCRLGHFRLGVYRDDWDKLKKKFENILTPRKALVDSGAVTVGGVECRVDVYTLDFEQLKKTFKRVV